MARKKKDWSARGAYNRARGRDSDYRREKKDWSARTAARRVKTKVKTKTKGRRKSV